MDSMLGVADDGSASIEAGGNNEKVAGDAFSVQLVTLDGQSKCIAGLSGGQSLASLLVVMRKLRITPPHHTLKLCVGARTFGVDDMDMTLADLGLSEGTSVTAILHRSPLARTLGWTIQCPPDQTGAGDVNTIVDRGCEPRIAQGRQPCWWASLDGSFEGRVWRSLPANVPQEPHRAVVGSHAPAELVVILPQPTTLRAVAISARNLPREVMFLPDASAEGPVLHFRPDQDHHQDVRQHPVWSEDYMRIVHEMLPGGTVSSAEAYLSYPTLPTLFPEAIQCSQLRMRFLSSHEGRWVGINHLVFFE